MLVLGIASANKLQTQANLHLVEAKKDRYYQAQNRYSIMQYTRALKNMYYEKKHEWFMLEKIFYKKD
jgi:hypothetical protein